MNFAQLALRDDDKSSQAVAILHEDPPHFQHRRGPHSQLLMRDSDRQKSWTSLTQLKFDEV